MPNSNTSFSTYTTMMRVNSGGRPYAKDLHDLFSALLIQLPLTDHRSLFRTYHSTFTTDEAVERLNDLKFTHIVRSPDPADPSRQLATRTTTTFSMSRDMAKTLGQHFLNARLAENVTDPQNRTIKDKGIWQPTPKGKFMIQDFSQRARVSISHMQETLARIESFKIVQFERLADTDQLSFARANMTNAFRVMMDWLPTDVLMADDVGGIKEKSLQDYKYTFYGYQCFEWISEYTTVVSREEAEMIASEFVLYGWIHQIIDKSSRTNGVKEDAVLFKATRSTLYYVTERGRKVLGWANGNDDEEAEVESKKSVPAMRRSSTKTSGIKNDYVNRLLPTEETAPAPTIPTATVTEKRQRATSMEEKEALNQAYDFGFNKHNAGSAPSEKAKKEGSAEESASEQTLRQGSMTPMERALSTSSHSSASQDSGFEVMVSSPANSRPSSMVENGFGEDAPKDSQWARLRQILEDPLLRMYFRDFMKANFCEENVNFWVDYYMLRKKFRHTNGECTEFLSDCYAIYDKYLGPNAVSEVNIDHALHKEILTFVGSTFSVVPGECSRDLPFLSASSTVIQASVAINMPAGPCIKTLLRMYDKVNEHICRLMAQDSVPRFVKTTKYQELMAHHPPSPSISRDPSLETVARMVPQTVSETS
ncbi:regulator of G protein signaling domain-containing protein [Radiomyces spectabilis]|uniref:regulator of G protein signaling domain-containing protein n=1 Tax=Radiomyces spectabilis TaxID=64574 RepID=UPI0022207460|nr:regulator of G protein signaling domain-containing protein [Radiomyces spectabilis]KAI8379129.1 regulator of G protein signaling domain-containing protein [Radiomyces spectabilis]